MYSRKDIHIRMMTDLCPTPVPGIKWKGVYCGKCSTDIDKKDCDCEYNWYTHIGVLTDEPHKFIYE
jgi:hypothetical protein